MGCLWHEQTRHPGESNLTTAMLDAVDVEAPEAGEDGTVSSNLKRLTQEEMLNNFKTFLLAGTDTSSAVLAWCLYHLAADRPLAERCAAESQDTLRRYERLRACQCTCFVVQLCLGGRRLD